MQRTQALSGIAVIGMAGRFPQSPGLDALFEHSLAKAGFGQFRWVAAATGELPLFFLKAFPA